MFAHISRRRCLTDVLAAGCAFAGLPAAGAIAAQRISRTSRYIERVASMPRLFCLAYISPTHLDQQGQEATIAKYPLAIVPQANGSADIAWRNKIKSLNSEIFFLAYLDMSRQSPSSMGPGFARLARVKSSFVPKPDDPIGYANFRGAPLFDRRQKEWMDAFIDAAGVTLESYPYEGLFLDNTTVWSIIHPSPSVREEMRLATQEVFMKMRKAFPDVLLVGNGIENWVGLNGEMNENRPAAWKKELPPYDGQALPRLDMAFVYLKTPEQTNALKMQMQEVHSYGAFFGAAVTPQHVPWYSMFDDVVARSRR